MTVLMVVEGNLGLMLLRCAIGRRHADVCTAAVAVKFKMQSVEEEADAIILAMPDDD